MRHKKDYLTRLTQAARWQLPPKEAAEVAADYRDILAGDGRTEEALVQEVGTPWQAVRLGRPPKSYGVHSAGRLSGSALVLAAAPVHPYAERILVEQLYL